MNRKRSGLGRLLGWLEERLNLTEMLSLLSVYGLLYTEVDTHKPVRTALSESVARPVPADSRIPRALGLLTVVLFLFELITGTLLALYYQPTPEAAYASVRTIVRDVSLGWFMYQIHRWGAHVLLVVLLVRLVRFFYRGLYRAPRELLWMAAAGLFVLAAALELTGRVLSWDSLSYWSTVRGLEILFTLPVVGEFAAFFLGGTDITGITLVRMYILHIALLPGLFTLFLYLSFSTTRRVGLSGAKVAVENGRRFSYRAHLYNVAILITLMFAVLVTLAALRPVPFQAEADPYSTPAGVHPPWYFLAAYGFLEIFPGVIPRWMSAALLLAVLILFLVLPFLERRRVVGSSSPRRLALTVGTLIFLAWLGCTIYGFMIDRFPGGGV